MNTNYTIPYVIENDGRGERSYDIFSRLLKDRIVMLQGEVDSRSMGIATAQLLFLNNENNKRPIYVYIDSPGGSVHAGLGSFIDTMNFISAPVYTICMGTAASMGAAILSAGEKGHRYAMPSSQILVHPMSGGFTGRTQDGVIAMNYERRLNYYLLSTIAHNCNQMSDEHYKEIIDAVHAMRDHEEAPQIAISTEAKASFKKFEQSANYDHWMFVQEALEFGIIDQVLYKESDML